MLNERQAWQFEAQKRVEGKGLPKENNTTLRLCTEVPLIRLGTTLHKRFK
jgi:hypothetical protein